MTLIVKVQVSESEHGFVDDTQTYAMYWEEGHALPINHYAQKAKALAEDRGQELSQVLAGCMIWGLNYWAEELRKRKKIEADRLEVRLELAEQEVQTVLYRDMHTHMEDIDAAVSKRDELLAKVRLLRGTTEDQEGP